MAYYVYILARARNSTLYTGMTNNLVRRVYEHKHELVEGFSKKHQTKMLVYYEIHEEVNGAIRKEKLVKK